MGSSNSRSSHSTHQSDIDEQLIDGIRNKNLHRIRSILKQFNSDSIVNVADSDGNSAIHMAVEGGLEVLDTILVSFQAAIPYHLLTLKNKNGNSALYMAAKENREMAKKIIKCVQPEKHTSLINIDDYSTDITAMKVILEVVDIEVQSYLTMEWLNEAMIYHQWEVAEVLLSRLEPGKRMQFLKRPFDKHKRTIIHQSAILEATKGCVAIEAITKSLNFQEICNLFSMRDSNGRTPLHLACYTIQKETVSVFLKYMKEFSFSENRQILSPDHEWWSPLHYVGKNQIANVISEMKEMEILDPSRWKLLLHLKDQNDLTAYDLAVRIRQNSISDSLLFEQNTNSVNSMPQKVLSDILSEIYQEPEYQGVYVSYIYTYS